MKHLLKKWLLVLLVIWPIASCNIPGDTEEKTTNADTEDKTTETDTLKVLTALGVDTDLGSRGDPNGNDLSDDYNPLTGTGAYLLKRSEIYLAGLSCAGACNALFDDDGYNLLFREDDGDWSESMPKRSIGADVDGDGIEEVIIMVYYTSGDYDDQVRLRVLDYRDSEESSLETTIDATGYGLDLSEILSGYAENSCGDETVDLLNGLTDIWGDNAFLRQDLAAGDLDGDGRDEIVFTIGPRIFVLDDEDNDFEILATDTPDDRSPDTTTYLKVDTADFDLDGKDEIILVNGEDKNSFIAQYIIYDDIESGPNLSNPLIENNISTSSTTQSLRAANVATGDYDGDGLMEAAFCGMASDDNETLVTLILDTEMDDGSSPEFSFLSGTASQDAYMSYSDVYYYYFLPGIASGDVDGDVNDDGLTADEIAAGGMLYQLNLSGELEEKESLAISSNCFFFTDQLCLGDVNNDQKDDIVYFIMPTQTSFFTEGVIFETSISTCLTIMETKKDSGSFVVNNDIDGISIKFSNKDGYAYTMGDFTFCLPNVDDDSVAVRYIGHELLFTGPVIVATLASPPYWSDVNEDGEGHTGFGYISGSSATTEQAQTFSVGLSVGFEIEDPLGTSGIEASATVEAAMNWGTASTHEIEETWGYTIGIGEDKVVFTTIPFDVYYYEVVGAPDEGAAGQIMTVSVPRSPSTYNVERSFYNDNNGDSYDVTFRHTLGDPNSYYSSADLDDLDNDGGLFSKNMLTVGQSNSGTTTISLSEINITEESSSYEAGVEVEWEAKVGYATMGSNIGYSYGYGYSSSVSTGTYAEGEVPDIPARYTDDDYIFDWGLMAYPIEGPGQAFTMVTYYVD